MYARKKIDPAIALPRSQLRTQLLRCFVDDGVRNQVDKDFHLISAALSADRIVISLDDTQQELLVGVSDNVKTLKSIVWVNPTNATFDWKVWLEDGAPHENEIQL